MHFVQAKTILSAQNGINLYRGCLHGCIYCDSRSRCYGMDHAFEDIRVKENGLELLDAALKRKRAPCMIGTGAMSDPYLPIERDLQMTRGALELIRRHGFGAAIQTKSDGILRDLDLLSDINGSTRAVVQMTLTTLDDRLCRILEPGVCPTSVRIAALKEFRAAGIPTAVWLCPILPFLNDTRENILGLLEACADAGVKAVLCFDMGLTLREGNREYFYAQLDRHFPGLKARYIRAYGNRYACSSPRSRELMGLYHTFCEAHGILHDTRQIFTWLHAFERKDRQIRFF